MHLRMAIWSLLVLFGLGFWRQALADDFDFAERPAVVNLFSYEGVYHLDGCVVGYAGTEGEFYRLVVATAAKYDTPTYQRMLRDDNPAVRAFGLACLARRGEEVPILLGDKTRVGVFPGGCTGSNMTLEALSRALKNKAPSVEGLVEKPDDW